MIINKSKIIILLMLTMVISGCSKPNCVDKLDFKLGEKDTVIIIFQEPSYVKYIKVWENDDFKFMFERYSNRKKLKTFNLHPQFESHPFFYKQKVSCAN